MEIKSCMSTCSRPLDWICIDSFCYGKYYLSGSDWKQPIGLPGCRSSRFKSTIRFVPQLHRFASYLSHNCTWKRQLKISEKKPPLTSPPPHRLAPAHSFASLSRRTSGRFRRCPAPELVADGCFPPNRAPRPHRHICIAISR
jgi:hypothetical protein